MSRLEIVLCAITTVSVLMNIGLFAYAMNVVTKFLRISTELFDLGVMIDQYTEHLESVYQLETFYGDQTLQHLVEHSKSFNEAMGSFEYIYQFADAEDIIEISENKIEMETIDEN